MWYRNIKAQNGLVLLISLLGLGFSLYFVTQKHELSLEEKRQIQETVFSTLFDYITNHPDENPDYFFISVSGSDPSPRLLNSFSERIPKVVPNSSSRTTYGFTRKIVHKTEANKGGISIDLDILSSERDGSVLVKTYIYQNRNVFDIFEYVLKKNDGVYRVISVKHPEEELIENLTPSILHPNGSN